MRILITGGAGFVGSYLARAFASEGLKGTEIHVIDNLRRRGSELNLESFKKLGITFHHGDIRQSSDLEDLPGEFDWMIEASAEPSVLAGASGSPRYVLDTNLLGTMQCLEFARKRCGGVVFLSTSRVYSIQPLRSLIFLEEPTRFVLDTEQPCEGVSLQGIAENFPVNSARSFYGATKLASEYLVQEYAQAFGMNAVINRCGVIAGPGQFGKVDQGVFTLWVANHYFGKPLRYTGFGGGGRQVRDLLHPGDLYDLIRLQMEDLGEDSGRVFNVGGGCEGSVSLRELTELCERVVDRKVEMTRDTATHPYDIPYYVTDARAVCERWSWKPRRSVEQIVTEIRDWIRGDEKRLAQIF